MINKIKDFTLTLMEEVKYHDSVIEHKKSLEASLWGLEEQASLPENSSSNDQNEIVDGINKCQLKIMTCNKIIAEHEKKLINLITNFNGPSSCGSCGE